MFQKFQKVCSKNFRKFCFQTSNPKVNFRKSKINILKKKLRHLQEENPNFLVKNPPNKLTVNVLEADE